LSTLELGSNGISEKADSAVFMVVACIPAYNEEDSIARVILRVQGLVDHVIVCDDGSTDITAEIAERLGAIVVKHPTNMGYGASLRTLFTVAGRMGADAMVTVDGDGQHDPSRIPALLEPLRSGMADLVVGSRFQRGEDEREVPEYRKLGIKAINGLAEKFSYNGLTDAQSGFRAYGKRAIGLLGPVEQGMGASTEILLKAKDLGLSLTEVSARITYDRPPRNNPLAHGVDVAMSTFKIMTMRHPLMLFGAPSLLSLALATMFWAWTLQSFAETRSLITNVTLLAVAFTVFGLVFATTAVVLYVLINVVREARS
jgi:glycosyltransferase involved in cell wall biosynthesis